MTISADTPAAIVRYQMLAVKHGLKAVIGGYRVNRAYTPRNLRLMTENYTGKKFRARDYAGMIKAIEEKMAADLKEGE